MVKRTVNLHVEGVPNPDAMKFVLENGTLVDEPYEFTSLTDAELSPLARRLFMLRYVDRVLLNRNYITVLKSSQPGTPAWDEVIFELRALIQQHLEANEPILFLGAAELAHRRTEDEVIALVNKILDQRVRPAAQEDGGDILFHSFQDGVLNLSMHGACHHCPYARQTIKDGVEKLMRHYIPEVQRVVARENRVR
ncbi:MAG: NifU family protein [Bacteroidetes bacterium]|nr:MAG: NifU family protein [Bacteroidota bacterium]